jgi:diguanylate cyclase (GGDEF)-like protein/PAS domain S-box-containing protein
MTALRLLFACLLLAQLAPALALEKVRLQLNWKHQFQFAGYYEAVAQGYFREAGFEVELREIEDGQDPVETVLKGEADYGVGASELALFRGRGSPVVALAVIVQHSPLVLLANRRQITSIDALSGRRIMLMPHETELYAYLRREEVGQFVAVQSTYGIADLERGRVDAVSGYSTDEPYLLREAGFPYIQFTPDAVGIDFYGDTLFTTEAHLKASPRAVRAFREAVLRGWRYAMDHPEEAADLILSRYSQRHSRDHLLFEAAELKRLMQPDLVDIGLMSEARWQQIARTYVEQGMLPVTYSLDGLIYQPDPPRLPGWVWPALLIGGGVIVFGIGLAAYLARLNRRLTGEIAARRQSEAALRDSEERYRRLAEHSKDVIWTLDLASLRFTYVSPAVERTRGFTPEEVMAQPMEATMTPASAALVKAMLADHLARLAAGDSSALSGMAEIEQPCKDGRTVVSEVVASFLLDDAGQPATLLGVARDISERRLGETQLRLANEQLRSQLEEIQRLQEALQEQAIRDSLTGCFNRRYLDVTLERELARSRREGSPLSLLILDLDHFKQINDNYGHQVGDEALKELARVLQASIRQEDVLCRYGGEEFVILMPRMPLATAEQRAEQWRRMIGEIRLRVEATELSFTASFGVATYPEHGESMDELTQAADLALYIAKHEGRNRVIVYSPTID